MDSRSSGVTLTSSRSRWSWLSPSVWSSNSWRRRNITTHVKMPTYCNVTTKKPWQIITNFVHHYCDTCCKIQVKHKFHLERGKSAKQFWKKTFFSYCSLQRSPLLHSPHFRWPHRGSVRFGSGLYRPIQNVLFCWCSLHCSFSLDLSSVIMKHCCSYLSKVSGSSTQCE